MSEARPEGLTFILPIHNQATVLDRFFQVWSPTLERLNRPVEILLVDDGSTDAINEKLEGTSSVPGLLKRFPNMRLLRHEARKGYGASIRTALATASEPLVFYTGMDHPYQPADLRNLLHRIQDVDPESGKKLDLVNGYRVTTPVPEWRRRLGVCWRAFQRITIGLSNQPLPGWLGKEAHRESVKMWFLFGIRLVDLRSRFKLFRRSLFDRIPIQSDGDFVHIEILAKANFLGCLMDEIAIGHRAGPVPVSVESPIEGSESRDFWRVFLKPRFHVVASPVEIQSAAVPT